MKPISELTPDELAGYDIDNDPRVIALRVRIRELEVGSGEGIAAYETAVARLVEAEQDHRRIQIQLKLGEAKEEDSAAAKAALDEARAALDDVNERYHVEAGRDALAVLRKRLDRTRTEIRLELQARAGTLYNELNARACSHVAAILELRDVARRLPVRRFGDDLIGFVDTHIKKLREIAAEPS